MKSEPPNQPPAPDPSGLDEVAVCDRCGHFCAFHLGRRKLCPECYEGSGSCCPEFGRDNLWEPD